jgi:hypothetical protein
MQCDYAKTEYLTSEVTMCEYLILRWSIAQTAGYRLKSVERGSYEPLEDPPKNRGP